jgi:hypothetical protein
MELLFPCGTPKCEKSIFICEKHVYLSDQGRYLCSDCQLIQKKVYDVLKAKLIAEKKNLQKTNIMLALSIAEMHNA